jgi:hypothetical protein
MSRSSLVALALLSSLAAACSNPEKDRIKQTTQATYDEKTGRLNRLTADLNKDGKIDTYTYMDGTKVLRTEIDADQDGKVDKWEYHGEDGKVARVAISREKNGKPDTWMYPGPDGKLARAEISSRQDEKQIDRREWYEAEQLVRAEEDANRDGRIDKWEVHRNGALTAVTLDENYDGSPDRRLIYGDGGRLLAIESEADGRGGFKKRIAIGP